MQSEKLTDQQTNSAEEATTAPVTTKRRQRQPPSPKTLARKAERKGSSHLFYDSSKELGDNPHTGKVSRMPYVNHEKREARANSLKLHREGKGKK